MKKSYNLSTIIALALIFTPAAFAANQAIDTPRTKEGPMLPKAAPGQRPVAPRTATKSNFSMVLGTVSKIDASDPANVKLEIKDERDSQARVIEVNPATNITKTTDISELKAGDTVRIIARKIDNKEVALGVMFGKLSKMPPPKAPVKTMQPVAKALPPTVAKIETNK